MMERTVIGWSLLAIAVILGYVGYFITLPEHQVFMAEHSEIIENIQLQGEIAELNATNIRLEERAVSCEERMDSVFGGINFAGYSILFIVMFAFTTIIWLSGKNKEWELEKEILDLKTESSKFEGRMREAIEAERARKKR